MDRERYSDWGRYLARREMARLRPYLALPAEAERGPRFNSDDSVLARLESLCTETEFSTCPGLSVEIALIDAAKADWWYAHEKQYDSPEDDDEDDDGE